MNICQVANPDVYLPCREHDSGFAQCERVGEHDYHWVSPHTKRHDAMGNGWSCSAVEAPLFPFERFPFEYKEKAEYLPRFAWWSKIRRTWLKTSILCPMCDGCFWDMKSVALRRHPTNICESRFGGLTPVAVCTRCDTECSLVTVQPRPIEPSTGRPYPTPQERAWGAR